MLVVKIRQDPKQLDLLERIAIALEKIAVPPQSDKIVRVVTYQYNGRTVRSTGGTVMLTLKATEVPGTVDVTFEFVDAEGNVTDVDSVAGLVASDPTIVDSVTLAADGKSAKLHIANSVGATQLTLSVVENGQPQDYVDTLSVVAGDAVSANFKFGPVTPD